MANQDDLSVNINVGVELDKASFKEAKEELQFILELQKELGVEGVTKVRVGGYSTSQSPDRTVRNKAASQIEKMGGDWSGVDLAEKAEVELAKRFNEAAKELSKVFNVDFLPDFAASIGEADFALPKDSMASEKITQAIEDFVMNAAGEVTISPAMFLAAAEKVMKNNPNMSVPRGMDTLSGIIKPTEAFGKVANYDEKLSKEFGEFITKAVGDNDQTATKVSEFLLSKLKVLMSGIIDDAQKARERVFTSLNVSEGDDTAENVVRYADDAARRAVAIGEQMRGLQAGTTAMYGPGLVPEKFRSKPGAVSDPQQLLNVLIGEYSDEVTGAIMAAVPDPSKVAGPIAQILMNPYILGDKFASGYQDEIAKAIKARAPEVAQKVTATAGGGAGNPDIELLRKYLTEQKALVEQSGKTFMVGLDTEFNSQISEKLTELSAVIQDGSGKFVEIFKFLQLPSDLDAMMRGWEQLPKGARVGQAKDAAGLVARGGMLGIPKEDIGVPDDAEANFMQFRGKISKLVDVINLLNDLGIQLTGSNFAAAEAANIKKAIEYVNSMSASRGLDPVGTPDLSNVFDPAKMAQKLSGGSAELARIFDSPEAKKGVSGALGHLIRNIAEQFPDFIARYSDQFRASESGSFEFNAPGGAAPAHYALTDATASLIVKDFIEQMGSTAATLIIPVAKDLNTKIQAASGGSGSGKPPMGGVGAADKPEDDPFANRAADSIQKLLLTGQKYENAITGLTENEIIKVNQRLAVLQKSAEQAELLGKIAELEKKRSDILAEAAQLSAQSSPFARARSVLREDGPQGPLTQGDAASAKRYNEQTRAAAQLGTQIRELEEAGRSREKQVISTVKEEARHNQVSEQLTDNFRKQFDAQLQGAQAGKAATNSIKSQMQEQVNAQKAVQRQTQSLMNTWVTSRYALYDVGNFYTSVAQNLIRVSRQIFDTTQSYRVFESSFTSVERAMELTSAGAVDLRDQFIRLSEEFPISFEEISRIATLGAQMGIAADGVVEFTQTVAKFSSITGISADTVAQKFGKIAELADVDSTQFENLGSAVAFAGINAVATESEILTLSESIAAVANQSGITAPEIIGIATALASVGVPAEQARGVFTRVFADLDRVANTGGESLADFASVARMSSEEFASAWGTEGKSNDVFIALLEGINASTNLTRTFDRLNIVETREINTLTRLAKNIDVVKQALNDSNTSFEDGVFLGDSFEKTADNLDAKIVVFKNNLDSLAASFSAGIAEPLKNLLDIGSEVIKFLKGASQSFMFMNAALPAAGLVAFGAIFAGFAGIVAKVTAQVYAFRVAMVNAANDPTAVTGFGRQLKQLLGLGSGMIEMRDQVSGINERGLIEPVNYSGILKGEKAHAAELLKKRNIYLSLGNVAEETMGKEAAKSLTAVQLSRKEADAVNALVLAKRLEIEALEKSQNPADIAKAASMRQAYSTSYVVAVGGEIRILNERERAEYRNVVASSNMDAALKKKTLSHIDSANAINLETKAAATGIGAVGNALGKALGVVSIIATVITAIDMLYNAFANLNKVDLTLAGGGTESLREAIKKDTQAVKEGTMEAVTTAKIGYTELSSGVDKAAVAINRLTGTQSLATRSMDNATESANEQTIAIGENTKVWLANAIAKDEGLKDINFTDVQQNMEALGMDFDVVLRDMVSAANGAKINPFEKVDEELAVVQQAMRKRMEEIVDPNNPNSAYAGLFDEEYKALEAQKKQLEDVKTALQGIKPAFEAAFGQSTKFDAIFKALGISTNAILDLSDALAEARSSGTGMEEVLLQVQDAVIEVAGITSQGDLLKIRTASSIEALLEVIKAMYEAAKAANNLRGATLSDLQGDRRTAAAGTSQAAKNAVAAIDQQIKNFSSTSSQATGNVEALRQAMTSIESILAGSGGGGGGGGGGGSRSPEARIRTLTDYVNDLQAILQSAFDIRYQRQVGLDAITSSWLNLTKTADDAKKAIKSANDEINQSTADRTVLQYQLSVAERYNDEKRAAVIRAKLSKLDEQIIDQQKQLAEANDANNKTLTGNSKAAIDNRSKVRDLVTQYNSYLVALANSGMSSDELKGQAAALEQEFLNQGEALGYSRDELGLYTNAFKSDFATVIDNLPRDITIKVNTDPAMRAIEEFVAKAKSALSTVGVAPSAPAYVAPAVPVKTEAQIIAEKVALIRQNFGNSKISNEVRKLAGATSGSADSMERKIDSYLGKLSLSEANRILSLIGLSQGGFVSGPGTSTSDSIPAMLSKGEYVVKARAVSAYGLDFMNALNEQRVGFQPASQSTGSQSSSSSSVVYLSPEDRALLRAAVDRPIALYTENTKIAQSANEGNVLLARRGSN